MIVYGTSVPTMLFPSTAPTDYETVSIDFTFNGQITENCVNVTIHTDDIFEGDEILTVNLTTTDPDVNLDPDSGVITIIESSGMQIATQPLLSNEFQWS